MTAHAFRVAPEVAEALRAARPVVALETTLVTHGLPHPDGLAAAAEIEAKVRTAGAVPATIGLLEGQVVVGLTPAEIERLASSPVVAKVNLSNLAGCLAGGLPGSTTVAASLFAAHRLGIPCSSNCTKQVLPRRRSAQNQFETFAGPSFPAISARRWLVRRALRFR